MVILRILKYTVFSYLTLLILKILIASFDGKIVIYSVMDRSTNLFGHESSWDGNSPRLLNLNPTEYRYNNGKIISNTAGWLSEKKSPECIIQDLKNWQCFEKRNMRINGILEE